LPDDPDSMNIIISSSDMYHPANIQPGSALYIDNLYFGPRASSIKDPVTQNSNNQVKIYPNPASEILNIEIKDVQGNGVFSIFDPIGKLIKKLNVREEIISLDISQLPSGSYFYQYSDQINIQTGQFLVK
jgi:hypothetical protein